MTKIIKVKFPDQCIGCELCVFEIQRQLQKVGLEGALIRIFRDNKIADANVFSIELDPRVNKLDIQKITDICPRGVYEIVEGENAGLIK